MIIVQHAEYHSPFIYLFSLLNVMYVYKFTSNNQSHIHNDHTISVRHLISSILNGKYVTYYSTNTIVYPVTTRTPMIVIHNVLVHLHEYPPSTSLEIVYCISHNTYKTYSLCPSAGVSIKPLW